VRLYCSLLPRIVLIISPTVHERQKLQELVIANGAEYHADLTKVVTHLMAKKPEGRKYQYASTWGLHIVTPEWLWDSLERGMTLDEGEYTHSIPREERGKNAWIRRTASGSCLGKRSRDDAEAAVMPGGELGERRKLRRSTSQKLGSQNVSIWDDIIGGGFGEKPQQRNEWDETPLSVAPIRDNAVSGSDHKRRDSVAPGFNSSDGNMDAEKSKVIMSHAKPKGRGGLFRGRRFVLHGFDQKKVRP
jgi:DNA replication regulator DPB11